MDRTSAIRERKSPRIRALKIRLQEDGFDPSNAGCISGPRSARPIHPPGPEVSFFETEPLSVRGPVMPEYPVAPPKPKIAPPPVVQPRSDVLGALLDGEPLPVKDPAVVAEAVVALQQEMDETLLEGSISKARELQDAIERGKVIQFDLLKRQEQEWSLDEVRQRRADTERALQNFERAIKNREEDLERRISEYVDATKERQARELEDFVKYWQSEAVRRRYNRTSGELRNLRKQERLLFALRRLNDAEQVNKIAAQREKMEIDSAYRTMLKDYAESRQRIEERHEAELSVVEEVARRKKQEFECLVARLMRPWTARLKKLDIEEENTQDRDRLWNRKHHYDGNPIDQCLGVESWQPPALPRLPTPQ